MAIDSATTAAAATTSTTAATSRNSTTIAGTFDTFMKLLTTQLQHQDPTAPTDSNQFTQQLVAFAGVQQQTQTNDNLTKILASLQTNQVGAASSFIGTDIQAPGDAGSLSSGIAHFGYSLPAEASEANVTIRNSSGDIVFQGTGSTKSGNNFVAWDGKNSLTGESEPDGIYKINIKATDANGDELTATPFITGTVTSAEISDGAVMLNIGSLQIPQSNVTSVGNIGSSSTQVQG